MQWFQLKFHFHKELNKRGNGRRITYFYGMNDDSIDPDYSLLLSYPFFLGGGLAQTAKTASEEVYSCEEYPSGSNFLPKQRQISSLACDGAISTGMATKSQTSKKKKPKSPILERCSCKNVGIRPEEFYDIFLASSVLQSKEYRELCKERKIRKRMMETKQKEQMQKEEDESIAKKANKVTQITVSCQKNSAGIIHEDNEKKSELSRLVDCFSNQASEMASRKSSVCSTKHSKTSLRSNKSLSTHPSVSTHVSESKSSLECASEMNMLYQVD